MTDNRSDEPPIDEPSDDELLSAYLDGELTGAQLAEVKRRLAAEPSAAELVQQLSAMRAQLQALPRERVGEDLRAAILQRAERAMLLGAEVPTEVARRETSSRRRWVWAALAVAASLLLAVFLPVVQQAERPLARAKRAAGDATKDDATNEARIAGDVADVAEPPAADSRVENTVENTVEHTVGGGTSQSAAVGTLAQETKAGEAFQAAPHAAGAAYDSARETTAADSPAMTELTAHFQPACLIHIDLSDNDHSGEQFMKLLDDSGIALRAGENQQVHGGDAPGEATIAKVAGAAADVDSVAERSAAVGVELPALLAGTPAEQESVMTKQDGVLAKREAEPRRTPSKQDMLAAVDADQPVQLVLVETTSEQIEELLEACHADTLNWDQIRVTEQAASELPIAEWRQQYERLEKPLSQSQRRALQGKTLAAKKSGLGWATRLDANQYRGGKISIDGKLLDQRTPISTDPSQPPVQVLFILQQASGAPTAASGGDVPSR